MQRCPVSTPSGRYLGNDRQSWFRRGDKLDRLRPLGVPFSGPWPPLPILMRRVNNPPGLIHPTPYPVVSNAFKPLLYSSCGRSTRPNVVSTEHSTRIRDARLNARIPRTVNRFVLASLLLDRFRALRRQIHLPSIGPLTRPQSWPVGPPYFVRTLPGLALQPSRILVGVQVRGCRPPSAGAEPPDSSIKGVINVELCEWKTGQRQFWWKSR